jgi:peroxiredoxin
VFCRYHLTQLRRAHEKFEAIPARIVAVGQGTPADRDSFVEAHGPYPFPVLCDPDRDAFRAYGLARGSLYNVAMHPNVLAKATEAYLAGERQGRTVGDGMQLPGSFVVSSEGIVLFAHAGKQSSDFPSIDAVLAAL